MSKRAIILGALLAFGVETVAAQDAATVLRASAKAMGADAVKSIQYSGTGWNAATGQSYVPTEDWPRFDLTAYLRVIDYDGRSSRVESTRAFGNPPQGGGGTQAPGEWRQRFMVSGEFGWNVDGTNVTPAPRLSTSAGGLTAEIRQVDIWLSPHGFLKAGLAAKDATATAMLLEGQPKTIVSFTTMGKYRINGTITADNLVERVQTWVGNAFFGDMVFEHRYTEYKDYNGVKFPTILHSHQGDPRLNPGHNFQEIRVTSVEVNPANAALPVPDSIRKAPPLAPRVVSDQLAPGVWRMAGESHNSVAVEFRDFVAVVEAPQDEKRSLAVIAEIKRLVPSKPIRYVVNTHHHFDHSGGLRTYLAMGATIVTDALNREFYEQVFFYPSPRTLEPDLLSSLYPWFRGNRIPSLETFSEKYVISDGVKTLEAHILQGVDHSNMAVAYLPAEKILIQADMNARQLYPNMQRLKLDVERHVPIHGNVSTNEQFMKGLGAAGK